MRSKQKIDWLNHGLEFVVVVVGILLAFQLNQWSEERKQGELIDQHIANLLEETRFNSMMLEGAIKRHERNLELAESFLEKQLVSQDAEELNQMVISLLAADSVYIKRNAYTSLMDSGDVRFIQDFSLKNEIVTLYEYYLWIKGLDEGDFKFKLEYFNPFAMRHFDLAEGTAQPLSTYTGKEMRNIVGSLRFILSIRIEKYKECQQKAEAMIRKLTTP
ncbi:MAG: DUF6090 family protein [Aestuariibacter sp.]